MFADHSTVTKIYHPVSSESGFHVVCHHYNALSFRVQFPEDIKNVTARSRVQTACRLIGKKYLWIIDDRPYDTDPLALTARKLVRVFIPQLFAYTDLFEKLLGLFYKFGAVLLYHKRTCHDVIEYGHVFEQINALKDKPAVFTSEHSKLIVGIFRYILVTEENSAEGRGIHSRKCIKQSGFARTRRPHYNSEVLFPDLKIKILDDMLLQAAVRK